ncbi:GDSL-like lipase/acylhydrolase family protein [Herbihabitans rhizosphaerae]|uniref:GDSL-like lipase/acylhydrolase family protein n=1 Tax=Herbihabitans rhizosphaerae TaxID=1872711 RepID=A0A4Q7L1S0_9PSEU|nr:SGNH/GDSL hydrolase family protein [Herbihabitans rhizosphaerae]RZS43488.1 GDSL-like lipase/acylhydrolase family protein [Herbihabitans rhizosphaerae]
MRRARRWASGLAAAVLATGVITAQAFADNASAEPARYAALGDSAAAGPLVPPIDWSDPFCARSLANYPHVLAESLGATLTDVSCSGAVTPDLAKQYNVLNQNTDIVTITIGGNDVGLVQAALGCLNLFPEPIGFSCADRMTSGGRDQLAEKIESLRPVWTNAFAEAKRNAPNAEIYIVGYGTYLPKGGCPTQIPMWARDSDYIQASISKMNDALEAVATSAGVTFVDLEPSTVDHTVCAPPNKRFYEPLLPGNPAAPLHPNAAGMANAAKVIAGAR